MSYRENTLQALRAFLENMVAEGLLAKEVGLNATAKQVVNASFGQILKIADESLPLARVMDNSHLVLHAEGPGATHDLPWLSVLTWLSATAGNNLRQLTSAMFDLLGTDGNALAKSLDVRLSGIAPGSMWLGVKLMPPPVDLLPTDSALMEAIIHQVAVLPQLVRFIDEEGLRPGIEEASPDPALRDVQLTALFKFSPTGNRGIHTLEISSQEGGTASLSQRERVVLREAIAKPDSRQAIAGTFTGHVREADLDKRRLHLRGVEDVGTLRCVVPDLTPDQARGVLGHLVRAEGRYQVNKDGRPRLLFVDRITPIIQGTLSI